MSGKSSATPQNGIKQLGLFHYAPPSTVMGRSQDEGCIPRISWKLLL